MQETKIQFSPAEMELLCNAEVILTKNKIIEKIKNQFTALQDEMLLYIKQNAALPQDIFLIPAKISKGENYLGLPYLVLDYPRKFSSQNTFAIRTMFWWGNFFSITFQISGANRTQYVEKIIDSYKELSETNHFIGINEDPWLHHFENDNYQQIALLDKHSFEQACKKPEHLKIAAKFPLRDVHVYRTLLEDWKRLLTICFQ